MNRYFTACGVIGFIVFVGGLQSCQPDMKPDQGLKGKWIIIKAFRNGQSTTTLEDAYFKFNSDSTFITNIFESEESYGYRPSEDGFTQLGNNPIDYVVDATNPDTVLIKTNIRKYQFSFIAVRDTIKEEKLVQ